MVAYLLWATLTTAAIVTDTITNPIVAVAAIAGFALAWRHAQR